MIADRHLRLVAGLLAAGLAGACTGAKPVPPLPPPLSPSPDSSRFVDAAGRAILLRGVNARVAGIFDVSFADGRQPLEMIPALDANEVAQMRQFGFNVLRLPVNWSGLEPSPGQFDEAYLARVAAVVDLCRAAEMYVLLDMHQDAYSKEIGEDGAPLWAIAPPPTMLLGGPLTDLSNRRISTQVTDAFQSFFSDQNNLQEEFGKALAHLATRFVADQAVIGYELLNEPFTFSSKLLEDFHVKAAAALRTVDDRHLVFFEPFVFRNYSDSAPISPTPFPDRKAVYAPHLYTFSFGDPTNKLATLLESDLAPSMQAAQAEAQAWRAPLFVGEFAIGPGSPNAVNWLTWEVDLQDQLFASSTLWVWKEYGGWGLFSPDASGGWTWKRPYADALARVYPQAVAGAPQTLHYDVPTKTMTLQFLASVPTIPHTVFLPGPPFASGVATATCDGAALRVLPRDSRRGTVDLACGGGDGKSHTLTVTDP